MDKRAAIRKEALTEFSKNSFENASVNTIIQAANTSKGNFYHYFSSKEELYIDLLKDAWRKKMEFMHAPREMDIFTYLENQILAGITFSRENPEYYALSKRFSEEKNTEIYHRVLKEIANETPAENSVFLLNSDYDTSMISHDFSMEFVNSFIHMVLNHINDIIEENDDIADVEEKLHLIIRVLKHGFIQN